MTLQEQIIAKRKAKRQEVYDWWRANGESVKETAQHFGLTQTRVYHILRQILEQDQEAIDES